MNNTLTTYKFFTSPEREEAWLEQMAAQGWRLVKVSSFPLYTFARSTPEKRVFKIDYRSFKDPAEREDYLALFRDSGWEPVMAREVNYALYFSTIQDSARRDIFSDEVSRAQRNLRYASQMGCSVLPAFLPMLVLVLTGTIGIGDIGYMTPGLWQMSGPAFTRAFLFETPFVILRAGIILLPLIPVTLGLAFLLRYSLDYRKAVRQQAV